MTSFVKDQNGKTGALTETSTTVRNGFFTSIQVFEDTTFATFVEDNSAGGSMTGFAIPAGMTIFGQIRSFSLVSGKVRAYP